MGKRKKRFLDLCDTNLVCDLYKYYGVKDLDDGTNWQRVFDELYVLKSKLSYEKIMFKYFISESTLCRFIERVNTLAEKLWKTQQQNK